MADANERWTLADYDAYYARQGRQEGPTLADLLNAGVDVAVGKDGKPTLNLEPARRQKRASAPKWQTEDIQGFPDHVTMILSPLRTVNESNESHGGWRTKMARTKQQRQATYWWLHHWLPTLPAVWAACTVTLTRIAPRMLDDDNLQSSMKHVRDGVADWWDSAPGHGDDRQPALTWAYAQKKGEKGRYEVEIRLERRAM